MKHKPYRNLVYILIRALGFLLYPLPLNAGRKAGAFIGRLVFRILQKERKKTLEHLKFAYDAEKTDKEIEDIALRLFSNLGKNAVEWISYPKLTKEWFDKHVVFHNRERIFEAHKKGRGVIVLASHFGNWELLAASLNHIGCYGELIVRKIYIEGLNRFFVKMREHTGNSVTYRDESPKKVLRILRNGGYIGVLADQDVASVEGVFVDFFGKPAYTPAAPVKLAMKTDAALMPMFLVRNGDKFDFFVEPPIKLGMTGDLERDVLVNTAIWTGVLERYIRKYPDHWVWMHRRWKTKPTVIPA